MRYLWQKSLFMSEVLFLILFVAWYALALVVEKTEGKNSRLGEEWTFFLACLLSPPVMFILFRLFPGPLKGKTA